MRILIIGARAAGLKAACRARRLLPGASVTVIEESEYISYAACGLPYFLSADVEDFKQLTTTLYDVERNPDYFSAAKDVIVLTGMRAEKIDPDRKTVFCRNQTTGAAQDFSYDDLVLATGSSPVIPGIPGVDSPGVQTFTRPQDAIELRKAAAENQLTRVAILGAGYLGCELCEAFKALWGIETALFEIEDQVLPQMLDAETARVVELELKRQGVDLHLSARIAEIGNEKGKIELRTSDGLTLGGFDRLVIATGVKPRVDLAKTAGVTIGSSGGIAVNDKMQTNVPHVYAVGDCVELTSALTGKSCLLPTASLANHMGRVAANVIAGKEDSIAPICGALCLRVFDMNVAAAGLTAKSAKEEGFDVGESWGFFTDKPDYFPEFENISAKMVFNRASRRILGLQTIGKGEAIRSVDAAAVMIRAGMTLDQVKNYEHAYAPPYADVMDVLHYLSYAGIASIEENAPVVSPLDLERRATESVVLDVREPFEVEKKPFTFSCKQLLTVPFTLLRGRSHEIPGNECLTVVCSRGSRACEAVRILHENGIENAQYLGGGLGFFQA